jgi:hypothetical protein
VGKTAQRDRRCFLMVVPNPATKRDASPKFASLSAVEVLFFFVLPPTVRCRFFRFRVSSLYLVYLVLFRKRSSPAERSRPRHSLITLYSRTHHASTSLTIPYQLDSGVFSAPAPPRPESAYSIGPGVGTCVPRLVQFRAWRFTVAVSSSFLSIVVCLREL